MAYLYSSTTETQFAEEEAFLRALNISSSLLFAISLRSTVELGLLNIIAKADRGLSTIEIAVQLSTKNPQVLDMLERMLRLLTSYSILNCTLVAIRNRDDS
ncbi:hypothetical protein Ancab_040098 [Ancistrocladus abbreviatus]